MDHHLSDDLFLLDHKSNFDIFAKIADLSLFSDRKLSQSTFFICNYNSRNIFERGIALDFSAIGKRIKDLRKSMNLSQQELATGICTQAQISKIEKGEAYPLSNTLYLISQRLGVDVNYFFDIGITPRLDYVQEVTRQLTAARRNSQYLQMEQIVKAEMNNPLFTENNKTFQVLLWHKGICHYMLHRDGTEAVQILHEAISLTHDIEKVWSEREIEILLSIGSVYFEEGSYEEALDTYVNGHEYLKQIPYIQDHTIVSRLFYNIARVLTRIQRYSESISYCQKAVRWCIEKDNLYLLGELHYQYGYNLELQGQFTEALRLLQKAKVIFELQQDEKYIDHINKKMDLFTVTTGN
ncbi:helix-turn-helix domain-containing protein [Bacillus sp. cl95]|uniref:helix-turn-helix domain-containing protein n=1 Tax=Bacillus sp. cl95 TaxID=1761761 RepID=UPI0020C8858C|nr:tetratricopeptide repeat protein [Bacillus sp. cl95]